MNFKNITLLSTIATLAILEASATPDEGKLPNIIIINADDLGYGDVSANGATAITTPNIDKIAAEGIRFTNAHTTSATSTPSRFSMLTGKYAWRVQGTGIATGDAAMIIKPKMKTLPDMLQRAGYTTAAVGKWHLGLGDKRAKQNWNGKISPGLKDIGFDYSFIMAATGDRVPCVYVENGRVVNLDPNDPISVSYASTNPYPNSPTGKDQPEMLKLLPSQGHNQTIINGISRIGFMKGGKSALWIDEDIADRISEKAVSFIKDHNNPNKPFFLYFATNDIHVPRAPHPRFVGKTDMGARGDAIIAFDWSVGQICKTLDDLGIADNTILIITSDNGPIVDDGYKDESLLRLGNHRPAANLHGGKYSVYEGGTRVPTFLRWPGVAKPRTVSDAAISQVDFFRTFADIVGIKLASNEAPDSESLVDVFKGIDKIGREYIVEHSATFAIKKGEWKYIMPKQGAAYWPATNTYTALSIKPQLYNLKDDAGEKKNLASKNPQKLAELAAALNAIIADKK